MIIKKIIKNANKNPNKVAYTVENDKITYKELIKKAKELSQKLDNPKYNSVIIYGDKSINMIISIVACLIIKKTYIPVDLSLPLKRLEYIQNTIGSHIFIDTVNGTIKENLSKKETNLSFKDIAYIVFTSGTSGNPKGVPISYDNLTNFINWITNIDGLKKYKKEKDVKVLNQASFSFDLSVCDIYFSLTNGHTLVGLPKNIQENYKEMVAYIKNKNIDIIVCTPTFIKYLLIDKNVNKEMLTNLKTIYFCGEFLENSVVKKIYERFPKINIINAYGPSEATSAVSSVRIKKYMLKNKILPVGEIDKSCCKIKIVNNEIVITGNSVFNGYLNAEKPSKKEFKTKDIGFIKDNYLYCKGRLDDQIKLNGYRIELLDIENNITNINGVRGVVVCPVLKNDQIKYLRAYIEKSDKNFDENNIKKELKKVLPNYMIPREIVFLDKIPINKNYKYDRRQLNDRY